MDVTRIVTHRLGKPKSEMEYAEPTGVDWDDIGGLSEAKRALLEAIVEPHEHKDLYAAYGRRPTKGILLHGPPGNGKTAPFYAARLVTDDNRAQVLLLTLLAAAE